jgi:hypothetical protein
MPTPTVADAGPTSMGCPPRLRSGGELPALAAERCQGESCRLGGVDALDTDAPEKVRIPRRLPLGRG